MTAPRSVSGTLKLGAAVALAVAATALVAVQAARLFAEARVATTTSPAPLPAASSARPFHEPSPPGSAGYSNIYAADYVGPEACGKCHETNYELWRTHPHSTMNRNATATSVVGDFADRKLAYGDGSALFFQDHGEFGMTVYREGKPVRQFKVTRVVGSRFIQYYIGVQKEGPEPAGDPVYAEEVKLPFAYWIDRAEWFPQTYDETVPGPEYDEHGKLSPAYATTGKQTAGWKRVCVKCHNTYPYAQRFAPAHGDTLTGFPAGDVVLRAPPRPPAPGHGALPEVETWDLVTLGISCESCHFGGREHVQRGARISFLPRGEDLSFTKALPPAGPTGKSAYAVNSICHQCHAAEPQGPLYPDGSASWNAREAADLLGGACSGAIACTDCHNPHEPGPARAGTPDSPRYVEACLRCHGELRPPAAAAAHAGHPPGAAVGCLDCHMPRLVHGLSSTVRSHHISSPTDPRMLAGGYPNACNLCHLDRSLSWTLDALAARWSKRPALPTGFTPSPEPLGPAWLHSAEAVVRQVAAAAYARSPLGKAAFAQVLPILDDPSPPNRMLGVVSVEALLGRRITLDEYTPWAVPAVRAQQVAALGRRISE